jgi:NitT/TauT family transport system substrate-binding protein
VSHYLLARALETVTLRERDIKVVNTSDADIVGAFASGGSMAAVAWKPQLASIASMPNTTEVFDSSRIPGEILDLMVVNSATLESNPNLGKALAGAWYETMTLMGGGDAKATAALSSMAKASGTDVTGYKSQLATTRLFANPVEAQAFTVAPNLVKSMDLVRTFSFAHGLLGNGARTADAIGIQFAGGKTLGDPKNIKLRFDPAYMQLAADGKL